MNKLLQTLYTCFYTPRPDERLTKVVDENHRELIATLSKEDRRKVLKIIDAQDELAVLQSIDSFSRGFQLATQLAAELACYGDQVPVSYTRFKPTEAFDEESYRADIAAERK